MQVGNHLVLRVDLPEGPVFADVGFGSGPLEPFAIAPASFSSHGFPYSLARADGDWWRMTELRGGNAFSYDVRTVAADEALLAEKCAWLQVAPQSPFVQNLVVQKHTADGIAVLQGRVLKHFAQDRLVDERLIESADDLVETLGREYGLDVPEAATLWPKIVARHEAVVG